MTIIGDEIRQARKYSGWSMREIHERGGPSPAYQSEVETGKRAGVTIPCFFRWSEAIGVDPVELLDVIYQKTYDQRGCGTP